MNKREEQQKQLYEETHTGSTAKDVLNAAKHTAANILTSPVHGAMALGETFRQRGYADPRAPIDTNAASYRMQNYSEDVESTVTGRIEESGTPASKVLGKAYQVGTSVGKSAMSMGTI